MKPHEITAEAMKRTSEAARGYSLRSLLKIIHVTAKEGRRRTNCPFALDEKEVVALRERGFMIGSVNGVVGAAGAQISW